MKRTYVYWTIGTILYAWWFRNVTQVFLPAGFEYIRGLLILVGVGQICLIVGVTGAIKSDTKRAELQNANLSLDDLPDSDLEQ